MRKGFVSEDRLAPYLHGRHRAEHGVHYCGWRREMTGTDRNLSLQFVPELPVVIELTVEDMQ